jgi:hypothetical protein
MEKCHASLPNLVNKVVHFRNFISSRLSFLIHILNTTVIGTSSRISRLHNNFIISVGDPTMRCL